MQVDYIIAGSGCAGLSLLYRILHEPTLRHKKILVLDKGPKVHNDRTWCYWEKGEGAFESIVYHKWKTLQFFSTAFKKQFPLKHHQYKMIRGIDFYNYVLNYAGEFKNVVFKYEDIQKIDSKSGLPFVQTEQSIYNASYVFNSTALFHPKINTRNTLLQHFEGWVIKTADNVFDPDVGTLMDFRLKQHDGATFMYVLPSKPNEALVEYTLFSPERLPRQDYKKALKEYIKEELRIDDYELIHTEFGVIPMTLAKFSRHAKSTRNIVNIGTAGGFTKASSGYTFQFIQENTKSIVDALKKGHQPNLKLSLRDKIYQWYDRTLLEVLLSKKMSGKAIFSMLFKKVQPERILVFLGNKSSFLDDLIIMKSLPFMLFLKAGVRQLWFNK
ncbi:lycopene beta-cyclase [Saccharicrinis carchari]|uniref:Lycopene beta-cyclase n=1 Tax=Saccharicrinis carchari TaxID=1168039 RepID=A0A521CRS7_SACCC|nr:lycopene cyclase family protein [Saccharicrinis carchari]SMO62085.1 lycopene beta-cyclase [Saccharicrinis carchari]